MIGCCSWSACPDTASPQFYTGTNKRFNSGVISLPRLDFICVQIHYLVRITGLVVTVGLINKRGLKQLSSFIRKIFLLHLFFILTCIMDNLIVRERRRIRCLSAVKIFELNIGLYEANHSHHSLDYYIINFQTEYQYIQTQLINEQINHCWVMCFWCLSSNFANHGLIDLFTI